jgi:two-component system, NarL family, response regulator LiaR
VSVHGPIRVVVVDDHPMVRAGIRVMLLSVDDIELVGEAPDGEDALQVCATVHPHVVLMDLKLPRMDGIVAIRELLRRDAAVHVLVLTTFYEEQLVREAMRAGAVSYLLKNVEADELIDAIRAAQKGQSILSPEAKEVLVNGQANIPPEPPVDLTEREREVLAQVVAGLRNQEIARKLVITEATVKYHIGRLFAKLGVSTRTELVRVAIKRRLVDPS